ncbi:hypothetical protein HHI36_007766 [Cryptolaemus montrouzieri]|uniref:Uncharacterized protein n=1 Tax=Cryptolaemus montrouzieri TaxID=559131 RepID=A0ABD2MQN2_9CUCU
MGENLSCGTCLNTELHIELRDELSREESSRCRVFNAPNERIEGVLRNVIATLTTRGNNIFYILRTNSNASTSSNFRKKSDDEGSEEKDFKLPKNTNKRMRKSKKTPETETTNQFESLMEEDSHEVLHENNHPKKEIQRNNGNERHLETPQQIEEAIADLKTWIHIFIKGSSRQAKEKQRTHLPANIKVLLEGKKRAKKKYRRTLHP